MKFEAGSFEWCVNYNTKKMQELMLKIGSIRDQLNDTSKPLKISEHDRFVLRNTLADLYVHLRMMQDDLVKQHEYLVAKNEKTFIQRLLRK